MNLCYIDLETTGLDTTGHQIVEIGAVMDGHELWHTPIAELPRFQTFVRHAIYCVDPYCIPAMAARADKLKTAPAPMEALAQLCLFIATFRANKNGPVVLCGKNVGSFDYQFLKYLGIGCKLAEHGVKLSHRFLDVGSMMVRGHDITTLGDMPQLSECLARLGFDAEVPHNALEDALLVAKCVRAQHGMPDSSKVG